MFLARWRNFALALAGLSLVWPLTAEANADCVERMSKVPMAGYAPLGGGAPLRAMTARGGIGPAAATAPRPKVRRAKSARARAAVVKPRSGPRKAYAHRARPKLVRVATPKAAAAPVRRPTPMAVAAADLARPAYFAVIGTTICESRPVIAPARAYALLGGPPLAAPAAIADDAFGGQPQGPGGTTFFPPDLLPPDTGPDDGVVIGNPGTPPVFPPPPVVPPETNPEIPTTPPVPPVPPGGGDNPFPPVVTPPTPPITGPPTTPPGPPSVVGPPGEPPVQPPTAVPEPQTWALLLTGFGLVGGILRRSKRSLALPR